MSASFKFRIFIDHIKKITPIIYGWKYRKQYDYLMFMFKNTQHLIKHNNMI